MRACAQHFGHPAYPDAQPSPPTRHKLFRLPRSTHCRAAAGTAKQRPTTSVAPLNGEAHMVARHSDTLERSTMVLLPLMLHCCVGAAPAASQGPWTSDTCLVPTFTTCRHSLLFLLANVLVAELYVHTWLEGGETLAEAATAPHGEMFSWRNSVGSPRGSLTQRGADVALAAAIISRSPENSGKGRGVLGYKDLWADKQKDE